ncbi:hypothetical protein B0T21DRAFT_423448, partial [Apiosordaria backusii]
EIGNWLSNVNFSNRYYAVLSKRQSGTGQWFLRSAKYEAWRAGRRQTLFCSGIAGSGKTVLTASVIEHLQGLYHGKHEVLVTYIYFDYTVKDDNTEAPLANLLKQILASRQTLPPAILALYNKHRERQTRPTDSEFLTTLAAVAATYSKVFVVVDALNESRRIGAEFMLHLFELQTRVKGCNINILASSRLAPEIQTLFDGKPEVTIEASDEDIKLYLEAQMSRVLVPYVLQQTELRGKITSAIIKAAGGISLRMRSWKHSGAFRSRISRIAKPQPGAGSTNALIEIYLTLIHRINTQKPGFVQKAKRALLWITFARRALRIEELEWALAVGDGWRGFDHGSVCPISELVPACSGLIQIETNTKTVRLFHYTAQQFLENHLSLIGDPHPPALGLAVSLTAEEVSKTAQDAHKTIADACIYYLSKFWVSMYACMYVPIYMPYDNTFS